MYRISLYAQRLWFYTDHEMWVWMYDSTGCIQSEGINFTYDKSRFLLLLFVFQRFSLEDWGFQRTLDPRIEAYHSPQKSPAKEIAARLFPGQSVKLRGRSAFHIEEITYYTSPDGKESTRIRTTLPAYRSRFTLIRHGAQVLVGEAPDGSGKVAVKYYWADVLRKSEYELIERINEIINHEGVNWLFNHLPHIIGGTKANESAHLTETIRRGLQCTSNAEITKRRFLTLISDFLEPLEECSGQEFLQCWFHALISEKPFACRATNIAKYFRKGHRRLWELGIQHCDISLGNIMARKVGDRKYGVLNDWDLSLIPDAEGQYRQEEMIRERAGIVPFMALETLTADFWNGTMKREYYHELESFIWILPWVFLQHHEKDTAPLSSYGLHHWSTSAYENARQGKLIFLDKIAGRKETFVPADRYKREWKLAVELLVWIAMRRAADIANISHARRGKPVPAPPTDKDILGEFWDEVMYVIGDTTDGYFDFIRPFMQMSL